MRNRYSLTAIALLAIAQGCTFGGGGSPSLPGGAPSGATDSDSTSAADAADAPADADVTGVEPTDSGGAEPSATGDASTGDPSDTDADGKTTGEPTEGPVLEFVDAPEYEFGRVALSQPEARTLLLRNVGTVDATGVEGSLDPTFSFVDGAFPGTGGTCSDALEVGASCSVAVIPTPSELGGLSGVLVVTYVGDGVEGDASVELRADVNSGELLTNNDFEDCTGFTTAGWEPTTDGNWFCDGATDGVQPYAGEFMVMADSGPDGQAYRVRQVVGLADYAAEIDSGVLSLSLSVWATALDVDDDEYRVSMRYYDGDDELLDTYASGWQTGNGWTEYTDVRTAPAGTREVRLRLSCLKQSGNKCNAYFDEASLVASVP